MDPPKNGPERNGSCYWLSLEMLKSIPQTQSVYLSASMMLFILDSGVCIAAYYSTRQAKTVNLIAPKIDFFRAIGCQDHSQKG